MQSWEISVTHRCVPWGDAWEADVRRAFAAIGWMVTSMGATCSSTHVEEDYLTLASSRKEFDPAVLMDVLSRLGVHQVEYIEDNGGQTHFREWKATIDEYWWDRCSDPRAMVAAVSPQPEDHDAADAGSAGVGTSHQARYEARLRKFWLCACAVGRFCKQRFKDRAGPVFDVLERFADGKASADELRAARDTHLARDPSDPWPLTSDAWPYPYPFSDTPGYPGTAFWWNAKSFALAIVCEAFDELRQVPVATDPRGQQFTPTDPVAFDRLSAAAGAVLVPLVRDVFGNPFRSVKAEASWLRWNDGTVSKLARAIYEDRRFDEMALLADGLEESGCTEPNVLVHCRTAGPHVRGCWVLDLLLGRE
ncbi:MAG TPA: hypothetical protein VFA26_00925 [Gemmataceae bacterium]|nr:hypothetical protein [Gemmataceae bacterium]